MKQKSYLNAVGGIGIMVTVMNYKEKTLFLTSLFWKDSKELLKIEEFTNRGEKMEKSMGKAVNIGAAIMDIDASFIGDYERNTVTINFRNVY